MATTKKSAKAKSPNLQWGVMSGYADALFVYSFWDVGLHASMEDVLKSKSFDEFMVETDHPEDVYVVAVDKNKRTVLFKLLRIIRSGYTYKEVE